MAQARMADWLNLHGITAAQARALLPELPRQPAPAPNPVLASDQLIATVTRALSQALPQGREALARIGSEVVINLSPDPARFPRAFTAHDPVTGRLHISCPTKGKAVDLLILAHEFGHVVQALENTVKIAPVLRETAAYLAEAALVRGLDPSDPLAGTLQSLLTARRARSLIRQVPPLIRALSDPDATYDYGWNYPVAATLAARAGDLGWAIQRGRFTDIAGLLAGLQSAR